MYSASPPLQTSSDFLPISSPKHHSQNWFNQRVSIGVSEREEGEGVWDAKQNPSHFADKQREREMTDENYRKAWKEKQPRRRGGETEAGPERVGNNANPPSVKHWEHTFRINVRRRLGCLLCLRNEEGREATRRHRQRRNSVTWTEEGSR